MNAQMRLIMSVGCSLFLLLAASPLRAENKTNDGFQVGTTAVAIAWYSPGSRVALVVANLGPAKLKVEGSHPSGKPSVTLDVGASLRIRAEQPVTWDGKLVPGWGEIKANAEGGASTTCVVRDLDLGE